MYNHTNSANSNYGNYYQGQTYGNGHSPQGYVQNPAPQGYSPQNYSGNQNQAPYPAQTPQGYPPNPQQSPQNYQGNMTMTPQTYQVSLKKIVLSTILILAMPLSDICDKSILYQDCHSLIYKTNKWFKISIFIWTYIVNNTSFGFLDSSYI